MNFHFHRYAQWRINRAFEGDGSGKKYAALLSEIKDCEKCRAHHQRYRAAESVLVGQPVNALSRFEISRLRSAIFESLSEERKEEGHTPVALGLTLCAAAAAAALFVFFPLRAESPLSSEFQKRGAPQKKEAARVGLRFFQIDAKDGSARETKKLHLNDQVAFSFSNTTAQKQFLSVVGVQSANTILYFSKEVPNNSVDEAIDESVKITAPLEEGPIQFVAIFSKEMLLESDATRIATNVTLQQQHLVQIYGATIERN